MLIKDIGLIDKILLPPGFVEGGKEFAERGDSWSIEYHPEDPAEKETTRLAFYYRGRVASTSDTALFRELMDGESRNLLSTYNAGSPEVTDLIARLINILGNLGDNQYTRFQTGLSGAGFHLHSLDIAIYGARKMLVATGYFHNFEGVPTNYFKGCFFDGTPHAPKAQLEEIYLESKDLKVFEKYLPPFERCLLSIHWQVNKTSVTS